MKWGAGHHCPPAGDDLARVGMVSLKKSGPRRQSRYPSLISILELTICLIGQAHVTKMKLNFNFFPLGLQIPQISYCIFKKPVICRDLITCSAKLSLHVARPVTRGDQKIFRPPEKMCWM